MRRAALFLLPLLVAGCGGGGGHSSAPAARGGRATLRVRWPKATDARLIPLAAASVTVTILRPDGGTPVTKTIARPTDGGASTTTTFDGLPYGELPVRVEAFPTADGTGVAQARGAGMVSVGEDAPGEVSISLDSTVASLAISPDPVVVAPGRTATVTASARDAAGALVLLSANGRGERLVWSVDDASVAKVEGDGPTATLTGLAGGATRVSASLVTTDGGATVSASAPLNVVTSVLSVTPAATFTFGETRASLPSVTYQSILRVNGTLGLLPASTTSTVLALAHTGPLSFSRTGNVATASQTLAANATSAAIASLYATHVDEDTTATVTATNATYGTATGTVLVKANPLESVSGAASVTGGGSVTGTARLELYALAAERVNLACSDPGVTFPASVTIPGPRLISNPQPPITPRPPTIPRPPITPNPPRPTSYSLSKSATFTIRTPTVTEVRTVTITATRAGVSKSFDLTITP